MILNTLEKSVSNETQRKIDTEAALRVAEENRAKARENEIAGDLASEVTRATNAEQNLATNLTNIINGTTQAVYILLTTSDLSVSGGNGYFTTTNNDFIRLVDRVIDSQVILSIPDLSLASGIDENSALYLNNIPLTSAKHSPAKLEDFDALKRSDETYMMNCVLRRGAMELSVDAPRIANIRRLA